MKTVTLEQFMGLDPCMGEDAIRAIIGDKEEWTALEVLALENVAPADRLWAVLREEFIPAEALHELGCQFAEHALTYVKNPDPRSVAVIAAKRAWLRKEISDDELAAAEVAARAAARAAAEAAARAAARAAAWAARAAAWAAAWAARAAAWAAAWAARYEEREWQVQAIIKMLGNGGSTNDANDSRYSIGAGDGNAAGADGTGGKVRGTAAG